MTESIEECESIEETKSSLTEEQLAFFRELILQKMEETREDLTTKKRSIQHLQNPTEDSPFSSHMADTASRNEILEINGNLLSHDSQYLTNLQAAWERLERGTFGICRSCKEQIPEKRLEVVPTATTCIKCKNKEEKHKKRHGN